MIPDLKREVKRMKTIKHEETKNKKVLNLKNKQLNYDYSKNNINTNTELESDYIDEETYDETEYQE